VLDRMAARLKARPEILDRRREMVEHPFGSIKQWMNQGAFLMKGLDDVCEWWTRDGLTVETAFRKPDTTNGARRRR
jgi:hypothetical protein